MKSRKATIKEKILFAFKRAFKNIKEGHFKWAWNSIKNSRYLWIKDNGEYCFLV